MKGGVGKIFEYGGEGVGDLTVTERATITNMGAELGATTSVFPSDGQTRRFLRAQQREHEWMELSADRDASYDEVIDVDLGSLEPLIAQPHSPDSVVPVREMAGTKVHQVCIGSCTNSSYEKANVDELRGLLGHLGHKVKVSGRVLGAAESKNIPGRSIVESTRENKTAELLTEQLPQVRVHSIMSASGATDTADPTDSATFTSRNEDRVSTETVPMLEPADLVRLPKGQAFALIEGERLVKLRMPLPRTDGDDELPETLQEMAAEMAAKYVVHVRRQEAETATVEGSGSGF